MVLLCIQVTVCFAHTLQEISQPKKNRNLGSEPRQELQRHYCAAILLGKTIKACLSCAEGWHLEWSRAKKEEGEGGR